MATETVEVASVEIESQSVPPPPVRPQRLRGLELLLVMSVAFAPLMLSSALAYVAQSPVQFTKSGVASLILHEGIALAVMAYVLSRQRLTLKDIGLRFRFSDIGIGVLLAVGGALAAGSAQYTISFWQTAGTTPWPAPAAGVGLGMVGVVFVLLNPVFEELLARGYFMSELARLVPWRWVPPIASALLQGSYHVYQGLPSALALTACFLLWSAYFTETRRLGPVIFAHLYGDVFGMYVST